MEGNKKVILNNLEELLLEEEIKDEKGVVSAYTLYKALKRYFDNVFFNAYDNYNLASKINGSYSNKEIRNSRKKGFDSPYLKVLDIRSNVYYLNRERDEVQITFAPFGPENRKYQPLKNIIYTKGDDKLFCIKYENGFIFCDTLLEYYYEDFLNIFNICEKHSELRKYFNDSNSEYGISFEYGNVMVTISFNYFGNVKYKVSLSDRVKEISTKDYSKIRNLINDNEREIMKRIPVDTNSLDMIFQDIIGEDMVKRGKVRERKL